MLIQGDIQLHQKCSPFPSMPSPIVNSHLFLYPVCTGYREYNTKVQFQSIYVSQLWNQFSSVLGSIVVSIPVCHTGDRGSIPRQGAYFFLSKLFLTRFFRLQFYMLLVLNIFARPIDALSFLSRHSLFHHTSLLHLFRCKLQVPVV